MPLSQPVGPDETLLRQRRGVEENAIEQFLPHIGDMPVKGGVEDAAPANVKAAMGGPRLMPPVAQAALAEPFREYWQPASVEGQITHLPG